MLILYFLDTVDLQWLEHWWLVYHGCLDFVLEFLGKMQQLQVWVTLGWFSFVCILKTVYCVYSLESPHRGDSNENTQDTFMFKRIEKISLLSLVLWLTLNSSNYPCLKHIFMTPKVFKPLKFYCSLVSITPHTTLSFLMDPKHCLINGLYCLQLNFNDFNAFETMNRCWRQG